MTKSSTSIFVIALGGSMLLATSFYLLHARRQSVFAEPTTIKNNAPITFWKVQAIDTMKYSRDTARGEAESEQFEKEIQRQVKNIADTGATHVAIGTPYDEEFIPFMKKWIAAARENNLNVWFRGNFAGWEEWFEYDKITREEHLRLTQAFITKHPELFEDGDIFSPCPECENGGPGDPRFNLTDESLKDYRDFLIELNTVSDQAFANIGKNVTAGYFSMNGDVARLVMNPDTTAKLDNLAVVDHYVESPEQLNANVNEYAEISGGKVVLGEFGAPIPDIHGEMTEQEQADWLEKTLALFAENTNVVGLNYWTAVGGSTELWTDGEPREGVKILKKYFSPKHAQLTVMNELGEYVPNASVKFKKSLHKTDNQGELSLIYVEDTATVSVAAEGYEEKIVQLSETGPNKIVLTKTDESLLFKLRKLFSTLRTQESSSSTLTK